MLNLANKYRPKNWDDVVEQSTVVDILRNMCSEKDPPCRNFLLIGSAGCGKAQPLYSKVLTPQGYIQMKDVMRGTRVITHSGAVAEVSGVYPQGKRPIYELQFSDGSSARVSDNHLNVVHVYKGPKYGRQDMCLTTTDLIDFMKSSCYGNRIRIDAPKVEFDDALNNTLHIHPYLVGFLVANGSPYRFHDFICKDEDVLNRINTLLEPWNMVAVKSMYGKYGYLIEQHGVGQAAYPDFQEILRDLHLDFSPYSRFVPKEYLTSTRTDRISLLQGLMDGKGITYTEQSHVQFSTASKHLANDMLFLLRSLGVVCSLNTHTNTFEDNGATYTSSLVYRINISISELLPYATARRHLERFHPPKRPAHRTLISIQCIGEEECQCIYVDHPDHTYITDDFIPTHNTTLARICANVLNEGQGEVIEIDAASNGDAESLRDLVRQAQTFPIGSKWKVIVVDECHCISVKSGWQILLKVLEEQPAKTIWFFCTTNPEKIPATILSRVQSFPLSKISLEGIKSRLIHVIEQENTEGKGITYKEDAVSFLAKLASGGMRDALTLLDKALAFSKDITIENLEQALNLPNYDDFFLLLQAYAKKDNTQIASIVNRVYNSGVNFVKWFESFHAFVINVVKYIFLQDIESTMIPSSYLDKVSRYSTAHASVCLNLANKLVKLNSELKSTQYLQELTLTYLCSIPKKN